MTREERRKERIAGKGGGGERGGAVFLREEKKPHRSCQEGREAEGGKGGVPEGQHHERFIRKGTATEKGLKMGKKPLGGGGFGGGVCENST